MASPDHDAKLEALEPPTHEEGQATTPDPLPGQEQPTTVGTGSYVAISCAVMMLLLTGVLAAILLLTRWLS